MKSIKCGLSFKEKAKELDALESFEQYQKWSEKNEVGLKVEDELGNDILDNQIGEIIKWKLIGDSKSGSSLCLMVKSIKE